MNAEEALKETMFAQVAEVQATRHSAAPFAGGTAGAWSGFARPARRSSWWR